MPHPPLRTMRPRVTAACAAVALTVIAAVCGGGAAHAENYQWPSNSYVDCGGQYRPTVSSRATMNVQHFQSQRGSQGWWDSSPLWSNGSSSILRDYRVSYTQAQSAKILSTGYFGGGRSWLCE